GGIIMTGVMGGGLVLPKGMGFSMPAEWEEHCACWMAWPCRVSAWGGGRGLSMARDAFAEVARAISAFEPVRIITNPPDAADAAVMLGDAAEVIPLPIDDSWLRDSGMTFVRDKGNAVAGINWRFNAWGEKYAPFDKDDAAAGNILHHLQMRRFDAPMIMEGGSFHCDGEGALLTSEQCLLHQNRNPHLTRADIEKLLCDYLGCDVVVWLAGDERDVETDGHIDNIACFCRPGEVLAADSDGGDNGTMRAENKRRLLSAVDAKGRKLQVRFLPSPLVKENGEDLLASYINFYPANGGIVMPSFGVREDDAARAIIAESFAGRRIIQVDARAIVRGGGGIHCITQQQPTGGIAPPQPEKQQ
ncbi:MAG: agmatine deiminase family protein, partial [Gammaproteobacteria bacterium]